MEKYPWYRGVSGVPTKRYAYILTSHICDCDFLEIPGVPDVCMTFHCDVNAALHAQGHHEHSLDIFRNQTEFWFLESDSTYGAPGQALGCIPFTLLEDGF